MSAGLMSCVRENSPPLEMDDASGLSSLPPDTPETQKRRRFLHPLRNLRRIFRRRTVANNEIETTASNLNSPVNKCESTGSGGNGNGNGSGNRNVLVGEELNSVLKQHNNQSLSYILKEKREHSADGLRQKEIENELLDRDITDYQRCLSEGRLVDSDYNRDLLSQSHDSVFCDSESVTASSFSVLKAELADVLRKRRNRPDASDEDLGLPRSPTTPQRKEHLLNQSEGSLSLLSIVSSDMDDDISSSFALWQSSSFSNKMSPDTSKNSDEDLDLSVGLKLSHSAARHKMAVRPNKKKGPTMRHRKPLDTSVLPSTPEVNEESVKISSLEINDSSTKIKSQSLPPGVNSKILEKHSMSKELNTKTTTTTTSSTTTTEKTLSSLIYVNKNIAKSYDFEKESSSTNSTLERKEEDGFFKRLLNRNSKKKKINDDNCDSPETNINHKRMDANGEYIRQGPEIKMVDDKTITNKPLKFEKLDRTLINDKIIEEQLTVTKDTITTNKLESPYASVYSASTNTEKEKNNSEQKKPRSGPASRQRVLPQDLSLTQNNDEKLITPPATTTTTVTNNLGVASADFIQHEKLPPKSPKKSPTSNEITKSFDYTKTTNKIEKSTEYSTIAFKSSSTTTTSSAVPLNETIRNSQENLADIKTKNKIPSSEQNLIKKSDEISIPQRLRKISNDNDVITQSMSPPKSVWPTTTTSTPPSTTTTTPTETEHKFKTPKIYGLSSFQQRITNVQSPLSQLSPSSSASSSSCSTQDDIDRPRRKSVEKSKSFRHDNLSSSSSTTSSLSSGINLQNSNNLPSLPDLTNTNKLLDKTEHKKFFSINSYSPTQTLKFEINDNNLIKPKEETIDQPIITGCYTKNIIVTSKNGIGGVSGSGSGGGSNSLTTSTNTNQNITQSQIEENIDMIVKSSFVVLKKSTSMFETPTTTIQPPQTTSSLLNDSKILGSNISVTSINSEKDYSDAESRSSDKECSPERQEDPSITKSRRNSLMMEKTTKIDVPEFMKIQLNRIDSSRPKSHVVLSKNMKETENKEIVRRFSNENVEITENKPPLPLNVKQTNNYNSNNLNKSQESIVEPTTPKTPIKKTFDRKISSGSLTEIRDIFKERSGSCSSQEDFIERRKSVSEERLLKRSTNEKRVDETKQMTNDRRKSISDDENIVILRKKSIISGGKKDDTPELMKVFARRSLKIKDTDTDFLQVFDTENNDKIQQQNISTTITMANTITAPPTLTTTTVIKSQKTINLDSDKENQSSSEEKLDKLPKVEISISNNNNNNINNNNINNNNLNNSINLKTNINNNNLSTIKDNNNMMVLINNDNEKRDTQKKIIENNNNNNNNINNTTSSDIFRKNCITPKPFVSSRFGNVSNYRNTTSFVNVDIRKNLQTTTNNVIDKTTINNNNLNINDNNLTNNINNNINNNLRHTINIANNKIDENNIVDDLGKSEFKNILQRRAEWEKRAKEGL